MQKLTVKEEKFCQLVVSLGSQGRAYSEAYETDAKPRSCDVEGCKLVKKPHLAARIAELKAEIKEKHDITVDGLLLELEEARSIGKQEGQASAMVNATMSKAKLCGLDKQIIDHTSSDGSMAPTIIQLVAPSVEDDDTED
jgi:phage terminase small subunit